MGDDEKEPADTIASRATTGTPAVADVQTHVDETGRRFGFVVVPHEKARGMAVHFSAFFGAWGDFKQYRNTFSGYFHRLKMLGSHEARNWLFLCDTYGPFENGTYYTGEKGDFFVERAMLDIIRSVQASLGVAGPDLVTVGSSMGGTAALKFGMLLNARGIVAVCPHIDLDISARLQHREREVAFICPDGDADAAHNFRYTRQVRNMVNDHTRVSPLPRLFLQACADDAGLYAEQVLPLAADWEAAGGRIDLDIRPKGGHTSDWATRPLLTDAVDRMMDDREIDVVAYQTEEAFRGSLTRLTARQWARRKAGLAKARVVGMSSSRRADKGPKTP